ncbi:MAG: DUF5682 family protein, partial [Saprospiraceae bacterium]|nr:DUF5682 family protein [Saprospiraceae bacterium]
MDLPMSQVFALREPKTQLTLDLPGQQPDEAEVDPFRHIAALAGYTDPERWWDALLERRSDDTAIFPTVVELMTALRDDKSKPETLETLLREAWMRQTMRGAQKSGYQHIAVVCGAWHTPALAALEQIKASADAALLKGLKKVKTEATWIPWSFDRLATQSGYSAGVLAPAWYRLLFQMNTVGETSQSQSVGYDAVTQWLTQAARLLREQDLATSSAHVIEAVRLANTLAVLRRTALPGIEELREVAVTVLCEGAEKQLELIDQQLIIGDVLGEVPDDLPVPPLKTDFEAQVKSCQLKRETQGKTLVLDLRKDAHTAKSRLLHRLGVLGIPWGRLEGERDQSKRQGGFHEDWQLKWLPDFEIRLIEAGTWGNTVLEAATNRALRQIRASLQLPELTGLLSTILKAELTVLVPDLLAKLQSVSALCNDVLVLCGAVPPLAEVVRYGSARQLDLIAVEQLLGGMIPRVAVQLPAACGGVDEDVAADILKKILAINRALAILSVPDYEILWQQTLAEIAESKTAAPLLAGLCSRLRFDKSLQNAAQTGQTMRYRLSRAQAVGEAAAWLEGFLYGSGLLLLHYTDLWQALDSWVQEVPDDDFRQLLPLLRRTFSRFEGPEREKMLDLVKHGNLPTNVSALPAEDWDAVRAEAVAGVLQDIFG